MVLTRGRVELALHALGDGNGPALLLLHALYGSSADWAWVPAQWAGPVYALDFSGHGRSAWSAGGTYVPELLAADADAALAHIGATAVAGAGLGAYVALLLGGGRREHVPAALLLPGTGLTGGGPHPRPEFSMLRAFAARADAAPQCDPMLRALEHDIRPPVYATPFARAARCLLLAESDSAAPAWWDAARQSPTAQVVPADPQRALSRLRALLSQ